MTNKEKTLNWRLNELPTAGEVADLVDSGIITIEEAREIILTEKSSSDEKVKALQEQVEFLQGLVTELAKRNTTTITTTPWTYARTITTPAVYWADTSKTLQRSGLVTSTAFNGSTSAMTMSVSDSTSGKIVS